MVVRVGKRTLYSSIGSRITSQISIPQSGNLSVSKCKAAYQKLCENNIILNNLDVLIIYNIVYK